MNVIFAFLSVFFSGVSTGIAVAMLVTLYYNDP